MDDGCPLPKPMAKEDLPAALDLWRRTEGMGLGPSDTLEALEAYLDRHPGMSCVVRATDGTLIGALLCGDDARRGCLHHLAVDPTHRGRGHARRMLDHAFTALARRGILKCNLFLFADNTSGRTFWEHEGWTARNDLLVLQKDVGRAPAGACGRRSC
jgi:N-acetylglutamate synthase